MNWWWTVHERLFMWTFQELLMNCSWTIFFHNKFLNSSWTVMVNCSWTLVHEPTMWVFYELFMNCSWMFMNVHEQFIKSWTTFRRGNRVPFCLLTYLLTYSLYLLTWSNCYQYIQYMYVSELSAFSSIHMYCVNMLWTNWISNVFCWSSVRLMDENNDPIEINVPMKFRYYIEGK